MAMHGELLMPKGQKDADRFFTQSNTSWDGKTFRIVSNYYGVNFSSTANTEATVAMEFEDEGSIDNRLRYVPPAKYPSNPPIYKVSMYYYLVLSPTYDTWTFHDGKQEKRLGNFFEWKIEGSLMPWTTVNTAIRSRSRKKR
jgi:hypothetical protein